jgi:hypothetical protein
MNSKTKTVLLRGVVPFVAVLALVAATALGAVSFEVSALVLLGGIYVNIASLESYVADR